MALIPSIAKDTDSVPGQIDAWCAALLRAQLSSADVDGWQETWNGDEDCNYHGNWPEGEHASSSVQSANVHKQLAVLKMGFASEDTSDGNVCLDSVNNTKALTWSARAAEVAWDTAGC